MFPNPMSPIYPEAADLPISSLYKTKSPDDPDRKMGEIEGTRGYPKRRGPRKAVTRKGRQPEGHLQLLVLLPQALHLRPRLPARGLQLLAAVLPERHVPVLALEALALLQPRLLQPVLLLRLRLWNAGPRTVRRDRNEVGSECERG